MRSTTWKDHLLTLSAILLGMFLSYKVIHIPAQTEFVLLIGAVAFYPFLRWPLFGMYACIAVLPFVAWLRRAYYLLYGRPEIDPLIALGDIFLLYIILGLFGEFRNRLVSDRMFSRWFTVILVYVGYLLLRSFVFNILPASRAIMEFKFYGPPALFFIVGMVFASRIDDLRRIWYMTVGVGAAVAFYALFQMYVGYSEAERIWFSTIEFSTLMINGIPRPFSTFQAPVLLADYMVVATVAVFIVVGTRGPSRSILLLLLPLFWYAALLTSVRSNWIGIGLVVAIWFLVGWKGNVRTRLSLFAGLLVVIVAVQIFSGMGSEGAGLDMLSANGRYFDLFVSDRAAAIYDPLGEHSFQYRLMLWSEMFSYSLDPVMALLGRGTGTLTADSLYVTYLAEFGYPGFIFIISLIALFLARGLSIADSARHPGRAVMVRGVIAFDVSFAIMSVTGTHIHTFPGDLYFWFFNGVLMQWHLDEKRVGQQGEAHL